MATGYNVEQLSDYVKVNRDVLVRSIVLGEVKGDTIPRLAKQLGIKTKEQLNYLNVDPKIQDGSSCGFTPEGTTEFSDREIATAQLKAQDQYCDRDLLGKFAEYQVKISADKDASDMPFERVILDEVVGNINEKMEKIVWQGEKGEDLIDGFITLAEGADSASTVKVSLEAGSVYNAVKKVIMALPEELLEDATVFVGPALYRAFVQELVELNYFHYQSGKIEQDDIVFPGTNIRVHKTLGLTGDKKHIYASSYKNMVYGADMMNDKEQVRFWYDDNSELFKYSIRWNAGVATYFPDMVVLGTATADLV